MNRTIVLTPEQETLLLNAIRVASSAYARMHAESAAAFPHEDCSQFLERSNEISDLEADIKEGKLDF